MIPYGLGYESLWELDSSKLGRRTCRARFLKKDFRELVKEPPYLGLYFKQLERAMVHFGDLQLLFLNIYFNPRFRVWEFQDICIPLRLVDVPT